MNTATILIIAGLAFVAHADPDWCQVCQDSFDDVRAEIGNNGKYAYPEDLLTAFINAGNKRLSNDVNHYKWHELNEDITEHIEIVKRYIDNGADNLLMCKAHGACRSDASCLSRCLLFSPVLRAKVGNNGKNIPDGVMTTAARRCCKKLFPKIKEECTNSRALEFKAAYDSGKTDEKLCEELCDWEN